MMMSTANRVSKSDKPSHDLEHMETAMKVPALATILSICTSLAMPATAHQFLQTTDMVQFGFPGWIAQASIGVQFFIELLGPSGQQPTSQLLIRTGFYAPFFNDIHFIKTSPTAPDFRTALGLEITNESNRDWNGIFISM